MKKYIALVCALTMSCAIFASCGKKDSDKDKNDSKGGVSVTTDAETSGKDEADDGLTTSETARTKAFYESLDAKKFKMTMETKSDSFDDSTTIVEMNGDNYHLSIIESGVQTDLYLIDGVMYVLNSADKTFFKDENPNEMYTNVSSRDYTLGIEDSYAFVSCEKTDDGLFCEKYYAPDLFTGELPTSDEDENASIYKYYYKADSTYPEKIESTTYMTNQTTTITDFSLEVDEIVLPNISGWTDISEIATDGDAAVEDAAIDEAVVEE